MAKEAKEHDGGKKAERKHLHEIRTQSAHDGTYVHHHTYKAKAADHHAEPERQNVATSNSPEEAGQHVAEQMAMNQPQDGEDPGAMEQPQDAGGAMPGA